MPTTSTPASLPIQVTLEGKRPASVSWPIPRAEAAAGPPGPQRSRPRPPQYRRVIQVIDQWHYDGSWWEEFEVSRDYYLLELEGGTRLELYQEGGQWWLVQTGD